MSWAEKIMKAADARDVRRVLHHSLRELLLVEGSGPFSTVDIVEKLWPPNAIAGVDAHKRRQSLFRILADMADKECKDITRRLEPRAMAYGRIGRPIVWGTQEKKCPHCGGAL